MAGQLAGLLVRLLATALFFCFPSVAYAIIIEVTEELLSIYETVS